MNIISAQLEVNPEWNAWELDQWESGGAEPAPEPALHIVRLKFGSYTIAAIDVDVPFGDDGRTQDEAIAETLAKYFGGKK
ncbi:hypothetical protein [Amycolatopsis anabasis]|uniref:hypothetical protein n=1 Tax=Amycolatopsis anabasis TaxID=1840409 RepID=UPI00131CC93A|nr:hypothetical protein [Amycolatopsis anabasis]